MCKSLETIIVCCIIMRPLISQIVASSTCSVHSLHVLNGSQLFCIASPSNCFYFQKEHSTVRSIKSLAASTCTLCCVTRCIYILKGRLDSPLGFVTHYTMLSPSPHLLLPPSPLSPSPCLCLPASLPPCLPSSVCHTEGTSRKDNVCLP